jgi:hypothetical protein
VTLQRTSCLADCPEYTVELWSDGSVVWAGEEAVAVRGGARGHMVASDVDRIVAAFDRAGFFKLEGRTPRVTQRCADGRCFTLVCDATDEPSAIVTIAQHKVEIEPCLPELDRAVQLIDDLAHTKRWISP